MKSYGIALLVVGALAFLIGFDMDTTYGGVHNIGLLNERQNIIIFAGIMTVIGAVFLGLASKNNVLEGRSNTSSDTRKCPFCAELVKAEAIICRHCQKDLPPLTESVIKQHATINAVNVINKVDLNKAAIERTTTWEKVIFFGGLVLGLYRLLNGSWWHGLLLIGAAFAYCIFIISKYKKEILDEDKRRKRREAAQENVEQNTAIDNAAEQINRDAIGDNDLREGEVTDCSLSKEEIEYLEKPIKAIPTPLRKKRQYQAKSIYQGIGIIVVMLAIWALTIWVFG